MKRRIRVFLITIILFIGCTTERQRVESTRIIVEGASMVAIATISNPEVERIVTESLAEASIRCACSGSVFYSVMVPENRFVEAIRKLKHEPKLKGKWIKFI